MAQQDGVEEERMEQEKLVKLMTVIEGIGYRLVSLDASKTGQIALTLVRKGSTVPGITARQDGVGKDEKDF
jgi:hypothetical protein